MKHAAITFAAFVLAACASMPVGGVTEASGPATIPSGPLGLGDWRTASPAATLSAFQRNIAARYGAGAPLSAVTADLRRNQFRCAANTASTDLSDPPEQICRRTTTVSGCTHTWQVHLFDQGGDARLASTRGLYDRRCGGDGLLGGPGD